MISFPTKKIHILKLVIAILLPLGVGAIAGMFTATAIPEWYDTLNRPSFNPPNWIFGPVWTVLYILMGISLYIVWRQTKSRGRNLAIVIFFIQLILNFGWSFIFFYYQLIGLAFIEIVALWIAIIIMFIAFYRVKPLAAFINVPYLFWVTFATILNAAYYFLN